MEDICDLNVAMPLICEVKIPPHVTIIKIMTITRINSIPITPLDTELTTKETLENNITE